ncbi:thioredoxin domain-containing protein [Nocardioides sp. AE5]|uniref:thioredoxin domain-containing protein n=1 Tax=Nocardioides sp. AE5 TaxID=2962573 RepID=UPI0028814A0D|nr:thioredoxin domain-containing protein [Nocardioides sp. AE5]MDT0203960.1 thioredoxin domain-containing protein [Nocardioides sp. AE5]
MTPKQRNLLIGGGIVLLLIAILGIGWAVQSNRDTTGEEAQGPGQSTSTAPSSEAPAPTESEATPVDPGTPDQGAAPVGTAGEYGIGVGDPDAPVTVEIFEDYQCPHCADFQTAAHADLMEAAADGTAYVVYRPMAFLNNYSARAMNAMAVVLDTTGGEAALRMHELLFANQPSGTTPSDADLVALAVEAGAKAEDVQAGIESLGFRQWIINANDDASKRGVTSTPTVVVNGDVVPGRSIEELAANTAKGIEAG